MSVDPFPAKRLKELPEEERPRERMARLGPRALSDAELLAIFFRTGHQGRNAVEVGRELVNAYGGLSSISRLGLQELQLAKGIGPAKASELLAVFEMGRRLASERLSQAKLDQPELIVDLLAPDLQRLERECIRVVLLNTRFRLIKVEEVSMGSVNETVAHPREILRPVILHSSYAFVLVHNHPSGDPSPSQADRRLTRRLQEAAQLLQLTFLDHIIIGRQGVDHDAYFSFREMGLL